MKNFCLTLAGMSLGVFVGCTPKVANIKNAVEHYSLQTDLIEKNGQILNSRTLNESKDIVYGSYDNSTNGFFPGSMWYLLNLTSDKTWEALVVKYTEALESVQYFTRHYDVGFIAGCSL